MNQVIYKNKRWNLVEDNEIKGIYILQSLDGKGLVEAKPNECVEVRK